MTAPASVRQPPPPWLRRRRLMRLDLPLDPREGYVTLLKETTVDTTAARERKA